MEAMDHRLDHLDHRSESDPDVVFWQQRNFLQLLVKMLLFYEMYPHSSADKKKNVLS